MKTRYNESIIIDSGDETLYPGRVKGFFTGKVGTPKDFLVRVTRDLNTIASKPIGKDLLALIAKRNLGIGTQLKSDGTGKTVTIQNGWGTLTKGNYNTFARAEDTMARYSNPRMLKGLGYAMVLPGKGSDMIVNYNPTQDYTTLLKLKTPSFVALAHELIHAWHWMGGNMDGSDTSRDPISGMIQFMIKEEAYTVGAGTYENTRISENAIRREHRLPQRPYYTAPGDCVLGGRSRSNALAA